MTNTNTRITTGLARFSYEHLLQPHAVDAGQEPKYGVTLLIPKADTQTKAAIDAAIDAATQAGVNKVWNGRRPTQPQNPVWDGDGKRRNGEPFGEECKGCWVITASSKTAVKIYNTALQEVIDPNEIYSGIYGRACIRFYAYAKSGNSGIACGLEMVQKVKDGDPLGGSRVTAEEAFGAADPFAGIL